MNSGSSEEPHYNPIFEFFVNPEHAEAEQIPGIIAYGLYKIAKREWASKLYQREGRKPTEEELEAYIRTWTESRIRGVTQQAESVLASFATSVIESATPQIREDAITGKIETDLAEFKRSQEGQDWWSIFLS